jgi:hypothetical protein
MELLILLKRLPNNKCSLEEQVDKTLKNKTNVANSNSINFAQTIELEKAFEEAPILNEETLTNLSEKLNLTMDQVFKWFKEKRLLNESQLIEEDEDEETTSSSTNDSTIGDDFSDTEITKNSDFQIEYNYDE